MRQSLTGLLDKMPLYLAWKNRHEARKIQKELADWERHGRPAPPPHMVKERTIRDYAEKSGVRILIETGTYYGEMVEAMKPYFDQIFSIELSKELYENAKKKFAGDERIEIIHGDSGIELGKLLGRIDDPALFWLDGHYSAGVTARGEKDTPIYEELTHIFNSKQRGHVVIIDDARCFGADPAYPSIEELCDFIRSRRPDANIGIENDSIRII